MTDQNPPPNDLDQLLGASVEAAVRMLSQEGEFYPFALAMTEDGQVVAPQVTPSSDRPTADEVAGLLLAQLQASRGGIRASALCSDVRIRNDEGDERDAIRIELEAPQADPLVVVVPYADQKLDEPFGMPGERRVFV